MHPHRGIETITYMLDGSVSHRDSIGNAGVIGAGDVQWMTAGSGILHEEMPRVGPRRLDGFQIWVNLPREAQDDRPRATRTSPRPASRRSSGPTAPRIRVIAGEVDGVAGAVREIFAGPSYLDVALPAGQGSSSRSPRPHRPPLRVPGGGRGGRAGGDGLSPPRAS